jgi:histone deacetylase 6
LYGVCSIESVKSEEDEVPFYGLPTKELPTGLCYDDRMRFHAEVASTSENSLHPEDPRRIFYIFKELSEAGLVADSKNQRPLVPQPLLRIDAREATEAECCLVHTPDHYAFVRATAGMIFKALNRFLN